METPTQTPIVLITGLPGAGKTSLASHLRQHCGGQLTVIEDQRMECEDLARRDESRFTAVVAVIDASTLLENFCSHHFADALTEQIELASVIVLNKVDLAPKERKTGLVALLVALNPGATLLECEHGRVVPSALIEAPRFALNRAHSSTGWALALAEQPVPNADRLGISTLLYRERRPFHPERLSKVLSTPWPGVVRARGVFWVATRPDWAAELSQAGAARRYRASTSWWAATLQGRSLDPAEMEASLGIRWDPKFGDRRQELAFVGLHFDGTEMKERLDACILTDAELSRGMEVWQSWPDPLPPWGPAASTSEYGRYH